MGPYHIVLTHFPIALWSLAMLVILWRVVSSGSLAQRLDHALVPLLTVALLSGLGAYATGTQVWPWESISASPLGRNHLMMAAWTVGRWSGGCAGVVARPCGQAPCAGRWPCWRCWAAGCWPSPARWAGT